MGSSRLKHQYLAHPSYPSNMRFRDQAHLPRKESNMGNKLDIYNSYYEAAWANPPSSLTEAGSTYFSNGFQSLDRDGNVQMDKEAYLGMTQMTFASFADFKAVLHDVREEGDAVILRSHFEGTHTGDLDLSAMGLGVIKASGNRIVWPEAKTKWTFEGDKITSIQAMDDAGGLGAFLAPLGVKMPSA